MSVERWDLKDTLRVMTEKFNLAVDELNKLEKSSSEVNSATSQRLEELFITLYQSLMTFSIISLSSEG